MTIPEAKHCPHCGASFDGEIDRRRVEPEPEAIDLATASPEDSIPEMPLLAPGSNDDTFLSTPYGRSVGPARPDPILGQFVAPGSGVVPATPVGGPVAKPQRPSHSASSANFPALNLDLSSKPTANSRAEAPTAAPIEDLEEEDEPEAGRSGWTGVLLASYASAVTLALVWFVVMERSREKTESVKLPSGSEALESPRQSDLSKPVQPPEPIAGEHFARMGRPLKIGSLEVTPIDVRRQDVKLLRSSVLSVAEQKDGGKNALVLRLKLKNISSDAIFAPLDQAYLRERGEKLVDTFVTTADQEKVYPFKLAVESEWSIVGQPFTELRPGESRTVSIVTAPDAPPDEAGPFTWRVRLRTGINRTDAIGLNWPEPSESPEQPKTPKK